MIDSEMLVLVIELKDPLLNQITHVWKELKGKYNISFIPDHTPCPHIMVHNFEDMPLEKVNQFVEENLPESPFSLKTNGIGVFDTDALVIYLRWLLSRPFLEWRRQIVDKLSMAESDNWVAKTTLAYKDIEYEHLPEVLRYLKSTSFQSEMEIHEFSLYRVVSGKAETKVVDYCFKS